MKKRILIISWCLTFLFMQSFAGTDVLLNRKFDAYKDNFVLALWKLNPAMASSLGYHKYDAVLPLQNAKTRNEELLFCKANRDSLNGYDLQKLSELNRIDYYLILNFLKSTEWNNTTLKAYEWDPSGYNVSGMFADLLSNDYESVDKRLRSFNRKMANIPEYYANAKRYIKNPTIEHTALAIEQNTGGVSVFKDDLETALAQSSLPKEEQDSIRKRASLATAAINDYVNWLKDLKNETPRSFRLGSKLYQKKFEFDIHSGYSADEIYKLALIHKKELHLKMYQTSKLLWTKYYKTAMPEDTLAVIRQMINRLSEFHTTAASFQATIEKQIPELTKFIKDKDLIYIDPSKPLVVRKEPAYMAGVAGASINAPGPYEKDGNTYYNVGSLEGWPAEKAESYLREYNDYILQILNIHEAIPGHYTQLVYANQSPSIIKSVFGNNAMIEGWAVYTELMMLENGYGARPMSPTADAPAEMWLMYYKWNMRSTCNTILDYGVHAGNMTKQQVMDLLINEAFQQEAEADGKWKRLTLTQVQLCCYFTGFKEIYNLREEMKKKQGKDFDLKKFHEQFLSYGSAPVKYIRQMMLK